MTLAGFIMINIPLTAVGGKSAAAMATLPYSLELLL